MILIPKLETVVILTPRTGSGSLRRAIAEKYPKSMLIYRHMEADGVPHGYDRWQKVGVVRHPLDRLWSLYKFLTHFNGDHDAAYIRSMRESVRMPFSDWIVRNRVPFTTPYDSAGDGRFFPNYTVRHPLPENIKSQFMYLRPDLGTEILQFDRLQAVEARLGVKLGRVNATISPGAPEITEEAREHMQRWFAWDYEAIDEGVHFSGHNMLNKPASPADMDNVSVANSYQSGPPRHDMSVRRG